MGDVATDPRVSLVALSTNDGSGLVATAHRLPTLRWKLEADRADVLQLSCEIERSGNCAFDGNVETSGWAEGDVAQAPVPGSPLGSREVAWVRVRARTDQGVTGWSEPLRLEGALYAQDDWLALPVASVRGADTAEPGPVPLFRRSFTVSPGLSSARLYVSALGIHETWLNGQPISQDMFDPGWTEYRQRHLYSSYDVTDLLAAGENVLAAAVADGWWRGNLTWMERRAVYGKKTAFLGQLELLYSDGSKQVIVTDGSWRSSTGALVAADIYDGCVLEPSLEPQGWREAGFDDRHWEAVETLPLPARLEQRAMPAVRCVERRKPLLSKRTARITAIDCEQNLTGTLRLAVTAAGDCTITVRHAEVLDSAGDLHTAPLRNAAATDVYRIGPGRHVLSPSFTYHGFRYAEVDLNGDGRLDGVEVDVLSSDLEEIGHFRCSDARVNRLWENIQWSQRGNFFSIPTDCPQRDERLGWTGDIQVFAQTACANFDSAAFLASWLVDLALEQAPDGRVPSTVPNVIQGHDFEYAGVGWSDAATLVPWALYEAYADRATLDRQMPSMRAWVDWAASRRDSDGTWTGDFHLGDWLDPGAPPDKPEEATTDRDFIASAYLARSARVVAAALGALGRADLSASYAALADEVASAAWTKWSDAATKTQTGCALAIEFEIAPASAVGEVGSKLADLVDKNDGRIATGFLGTPLVLPALSRAGQIEAAYSLLLNEKAPGWLYQVAQGATTLWERWDAIKPGGEIHSGSMAANDADSMTSFNHYAYGSVGAWLYRSLAGIAPDTQEPGYRLIHFCPQPGGGIGWAEASIGTPFGHASIRWERSGDVLDVALEIPPGAQGLLALPAEWCAPPVTDRLGSGQYHFKIKAKKDTSWRTK